jgi:hypothetical protein
VEPTGEMPLVYRERAYAVSAGTTLGQAEAVLVSALHGLAESLSSRPERKFVQLAVFDHAFSEAPERAPLVVVVWKDWLGHPQVFFPTEPARVSEWPFGSDVRFRPSAAPPARTREAPLSLAKLAAEGAVEAASPAAVNGALATAAPEAIALAPAEPRKQRTRNPISDLISELFDRTHRLTFQRDIVSGSEFVRDLLLEVIPVRACLVHVFEIDTGEFVLVRASEGLAPALVLSRLSAREQWLDRVMRGGVPVRLEQQEELGHVRWERLGLTPKRVLTAPAQLGGRYLALLELLDPLDGGGFYDNELNAVAYIAGRFAEFLAARPIVLERDVILPAGMA